MGVVRRGVMEMDSGDRGIGAAGGWYEGEVWVHDTSLQAASLTCLCPVTSPIGHKPDQSMQAERCKNTYV